MKLERDKGERSKDLEARDLLVRSIKKTKRKRVGLKGITNNVDA